MLIMAKMSNAQAKIIKPSAIKTKNMRLQRKRMEKVRSKLHLLKHISKRNCALLPYLDDESLHNTLFVHFVRFWRKRDFLGPKLS